MAAEPWERNVWGLALVVFVAFVGFQFFSPFLPLYVRELGVTDDRLVAVWSGVLLAVTPTISGLLSPAFGRLADRFGHKAMLIRSLVGFTVIIAAMGVVRSVEQLFVARLLQGLVAGFSPMAIALASVSAPRDRVAVAIGRVQGAQLLSLAVGPAAGGFVASHVGLRYAFFATSAMCALALVGLVVLLREGRPGESGPARVRVPRLPFRQLLRYPHFPLVMVLLVFAQFIDRGLGLLIPLRVAQLPDVTAVASMAGVIISVGAVGATISATLAARLSQGIPYGRLLLAGLVGGGALCAAMALAEGWVGLLVLRTLVALCLGGTLTLAYAIGGTTVPAETRGAAFGWLALGVQIGTATSPLATGALAALSLRGAFVAEGVLAWVAAALLYFAAREFLTRQSA